MPTRSETSRKTNELRLVGIIVISAVMTCLAISALTDHDPKTLESKAFDDAFGKTFLVIPAPSVSLPRCADTDPSQKTETGRRLVIDSLTEFGVLLSPTAVNLITSDGIFDELWTGGKTGTRIYGERVRVCVDEVKIDHVAQKTIHAGSLFEAVVKKAQDKSTADPALDRLVCTTPLRQEMDNATAGKILAKSLPQKDRPHLFQVLAHFMKKITNPKKELCLSGKTIDQIRKMLNGIPLKDLIPTDGSLSKLGIRTD